MFSSVKVLIEKQIQNWQSGITVSTPALNRSCGFQTFSAGQPTLSALEKGGCGIPTSGEVPEPIDWEKEFCRSSMEAMSHASMREMKVEAHSKNAQADRLLQMLMLALQSGNISMAMMIFSQLEAKSSNDLTKTLMEKVQTLQDQKRQLTQDLQNQKTDAEGNKAMQRIQGDIQQATDDITILQTFIRDVAQNKQSSIELANGFLTKEHETTMSIVRSFGR